VLPPIGGCALPSAFPFDHIAERLSIMRRPLAAALTHGGRAPVTPAQLWSSQHHARTGNLARVAGDEKEAMKWPARLSFAASAVTGVMAIFSLAVIDAPWRRLLVITALPPILASLYQGFQYRRGNSANAFWPVAVYVFFIVLYLGAEVGLYFFGVILQSAAWIIGRRERRRSEATQPQC
jgi:hypothetical protein